MRLAVLDWGMVKLRLAILDMDNLRLRVMNWGKVMQRVAVLDWVKVKLSAGIVIEREALPTC